MSLEIELPVNIPYSSTAEAKLLGALLMENSLLDLLFFLSEKHFYAPAHQRIYAACKAKIEAGEIANPITLASQFANDPDLPTKEKYLVQCCGMAGLSYEFMQLARYIKELSYRRDLIEACRQAMIIAADESIELQKPATQLSDVCEKIMAGDKKWEMRNGMAVAQEIIDNMKADRKPYSTGFERLDEAMGGGLYAGKLYGLAGRKKFGKTILGGTISVNLAIKGIKHLFICGEMSDVEIHQRNLARMGKFFSSVFRDGSNYSHSEDFQRKFNESLKWAMDNIIFINAPDLTFDKLRHIVKMAVLRHNIKGYILDYWQLVGGKPDKKNKAEHLDEVAQWMAESVKKYNLFSITMAQINQEGNTRGGEGLRLACDQLYEIQRPVLEEPQIWLKMMDTRYTEWLDVGDASDPGMILNGHGPYFEAV
jgi:replicative DNA helicase